MQRTGSRQARPHPDLRHATSSVRWLRDGRAIRGATKRTLKLRRADAGHRIACRTASATSAAVRVQRR